MTLYLKSMTNGAKTFAPVKAVCAAIALYQKTNLFDREPTKAPAVCIVRSAEMRKFGLNTVIRKEPFECEQVEGFAESYGVRYHGYCHLVVATMPVAMFGLMSWYDDVSCLL